MMLGVTSFAHLYILSPFHKTLMNAFYVPGILLSAEDMEIDQVDLISRNLYSIERRQIYLHSIVSGGKMF